MTLTLGFGLRTSFANGVFAIRSAGRALAGEIMQGRLRYGPTCPRLTELSPAPGRREDAHGAIVMACLRQLFVSLADMVPCDEPARMSH